MTINLAVLVEARDCLKLLREYEASAKPDSMQSRDDFMRCLRGYSALNAEVEQILKAVNVEVTP